MIDTNGRTLELLVHPADVQNGDGHNRSRRLAEGFEKIIGSATALL